MRIQSVPANPFPQRFARDPSTASRGPNPGELHKFDASVGNASMLLSDYFPASEIQAIEQSGSFKFHTMGDSGKGTPEQHDVADAMSLDVNRNAPAAGPSLLLHLGDIIYDSDKRAHYANRFYRPNASYQNLIFGIPGNHDGEVRSTLDHFSLEAYIENFCQPTGHQPPLAIEAGRAMPHQPGAYWRLTCPFVDIIGLYSNTAENVGVIAHPEVGDAQKTWLASTLSAIATERTAGNIRALVIAVHHPPFASGLQDTSFGHPGSPDMLADMDSCCESAGVWPNAVLAAHSHNYQCYLRDKTVGGQERTIPYVVSGGGGIGPQAVAPIGTKADVPGGGTVRYVSGLQSHGYSLVTVSSTEIRLDFIATSGTTRNLFHTVRVDLQSGQSL